MPRRATARIIAVGALLLLATVIFAPSAAASSSIGYDVSWPNCYASYPSSRGFAIVGVTGGKPFTSNPCLRREWAAARRTGHPQLYINVASARSLSVSTATKGPAGTCSLVATLCRAYNYGYNAARWAYRYAASQLGSSQLGVMWWLDVETGCNWTSSTTANARIVAGALRYLRSIGRGVGIYSTTYQWRNIVGSSYRPGAPVWYATVAANPTAARRYCTVANRFTGGRVRMVQYPSGGLDADVLC